MTLNNFLFIYSPIEAFQAVIMFRLITTPFLKKIKINKIKPESINPNFIHHRTQKVFKVSELIFLLAATHL